MVNDKGLKLLNTEYGQAIPGRTAVPFTPDYLQTPHRIHSSPTFSPQLDEVYWSVFPRSNDIPHKNETILFSKKINNSWTPPKTASFSGKYSDGGPLFSANGKRLYFYSKRPLNGQSTSETRGEIWYVIKQGGHWGTPEHVKLDFDGEKLFFSVSKNNTIYFTSGHGLRGIGTGSVDIYCSKYADGVYTKPEILPGAINSSEYVESDPLISQDDGYLIFFSLERPENIGQYDLYLSSKYSDNRWSEPVNLGSEINRGVARFPRFSPDERFLFYVNVDGIFWLDRSVIDNLLYKK